MWLCTSYNAKERQDCAANLERQLATITVERDSLLEQAKLIPGLISSLRRTESECEAARAILADCRAALAGFEGPDEAIPDEIVRQQK